MKKALVMLLVAALLAGVFGLAPVRAAEGITIQMTIGSTKAYVNSKEVTLDQPPIIENGRTLVPFRFIGEAIGARIDWDPAKRTVSYVRGDMNIILIIGSTTAFVNSVATKLDVAPKILSGRTVVPVRFVSETIGAKVDWNSNTKMVTVTVSPVVEVVKIGGIYPLSGSNAPMGIGDKQAILLAVDEINANGGIKSLGGAKIEVVFADSEGDPKVAMTAAERLIVKDGVTAILGSILSSTTATIAPVCEKYKTPLVNEGSTSITLTQNGWKYFFRVTPHDGLYCESMFNFLEAVAKKSGKEIKTIGIMYENTLFGKTAADVWKEKAPAHGFKIVADIPYSAGSVDLSSEVLNLKKASPDVIFLASYVQDSILITKTMQTLNCNAKAVVGIDGGQIVPSYIDALGPLANYVSAEARWSPDIKKPLSQKVNAEYYSKYGQNMDGHNARAYTAAIVLYNAIEEAGSTDKEKIRQALVNIYIPPEKIIMTWKGVKFDEFGQNILGTPCIIQIQDQKFKTVYPYDIASADFIFPMPAWSERP